MSGHGPAKQPCPSCPYRCDVPSGLWAEEEYDKLERYDRPAHEQPYAVFMCHLQTGRLCAGWCAVHDMQDSIGLRIACSNDVINVEDVEAARDYVSPIPVFTTGTEAAEHGRREIMYPSIQARRKINHLRRRID